MKPMNAMGLSFQKYWQIESKLKNIRCMQQFLPTKKQPTLVIGYHISFQKFMFLFNYHLLDFKQPYFIGWKTWD